MFNVVICDDMPQAIEDINNKISALKFDVEFEITTYNTAAKLMREINKGTRIDVLIIDIDLGKANGIEVAKHALSQLRNCQVIFVSGYNDYYLDVYMVEHVYFVSKPADPIHLKAALDRAFAKLIDKEGNVLYLENKQGSFAIPQSDVEYISKDGRKIIIHTANKEYSFYKKFSEIEDLLGENFVRIHNSYMVNCDAIEKAMSTVVKLKGSELEIPVSRTYSSALKNKYIEYLEGKL